MDKRSQRSTRLTWISALIGLICLLTGCTSLSQTMEDVTPVMGTASTLVPSPSFTSTHTSIPVASPTRGEPVDPVPTRTPTVVPTLVPTLATDEALAFIRQMQATNGGCELPCWWGITPGGTTWKEAGRVLAPLRGYGSAHLAPGFIFSGYSGIDARLYGSSNSTVQEIWVFGSSHGSDGSRKPLPFDESWQPYSLSGALRQLGMPSQVLIGFGPALGDGQPPVDLSTVEPSYELYIWYDEAGLILRYMGLATEGETVLLGCFGLDQITDIRLYAREPWPNGFSGPPWDYWTDVQPLEQVTDLSIEEFSEVFLDSDECVESSFEHWPGVGR
jgi:hypothetical protein